jgi:hypothetical protein
MKSIIRNFTLASIVAISASGCAIHQKVTPVAGISSKSICIVENTAVKSGFLDTYRNSMETKGYKVRTLPEQASLIECPLTSTYAANWRWDLAMYMAYAEIKVYDNGKPIGEATYDARNGGGSFGKFISAETKIKELVNQLFPGGTGS